MVVKGGSGKSVCPFEDCHRECTSPLMLLMHQFENNHLDFYCCVCANTFTQKGNLRRHIKSAHLQEHYKCSQCPERRSFTREGALHAHELKVHGTNSVRNM